MKTIIILATRHLCLGSPTFLQHLSLRTRSFLPCQWKILFQWTRALTVSAEILLKVYPQYFPCCFFLSLSLCFYLIFLSVSFFLSLSVCLSSSLSLCLSLSASTLSFCLSLSFCPCLSVCLCLSVSLSLSLSLCLSLSLSFFLSFCL